MNIWFPRDKNFLDSREGSSHDVAKMWWACHAIFSQNAWQAQGGSLYNVQTLSLKTRISTLVTVDLVLKYFNTHC